VNNLNKFDKAYPASILSTKALILIFYRCMDSKVITTPPQENETLARAVYQRLRADLLSGALRPGSKLKMETLRQRYKLGASPIREALSQLTADGLVVRVDQRGFHVAEVSRRDLDELLWVRSHLEEIALRESIAHGGEEWEHQIVVAEYKLSCAHRSLSEKLFVANPDWEQLHKSFHMLLLAGCPSPTLLAYCGQLYDRAIRYRALSTSKAYPKRNIQREHSELKDAVLGRDADRAVSLLLAHYQRTVDILRSAVSWAE
jgi:GntR family transcriptional regulator, carbon starvation induced regulator